MRNYSHITKEERKEIYKLNQEGLIISAIAIKMSRDKSTISRELRRNGNDIGYLPDTAQSNYTQRRLGREKKIMKEPVLMNYILEKMRLKWSPEQIAGRLKIDKTIPSVSTETIYQFVYSNTGKRYCLYLFLRYKRQKRGQIHGRNSRTTIIKNRISIHERNKAINERIEEGHLEGDLTFFKGNQSVNLAVLVERTSRLTMLVKNESKHTALVIDRIIEKIKHMSFKSITFDNGSEFAMHTKLNETLKMPTYFCDPSSPWQKGSVENLISRLHRHIPKGGDLSQWSDREILAVEMKLNQTPRKILGYYTPLEVFSNKFSNVALQT